MESTIEKIECPFSTKCLSMDSTDCTVSKIVYKWNCLRCQEDGTRSHQVNTNISEDARDFSMCGGSEREMIYIGTSGYSLHKRTLEHWNNIMHGNANGSSIAKHQYVFHEGEVPMYTCKTLQTFKKTLGHYIWEALELDRARKTNDVMNQKSEWGMLRLPRLQLTDTADK